MLGRTRFHTRARGSGAGAGSTTTTDLQRILALSPSLLIWPANGAGWQGTSGGTLAASGQPLGLGVDLAALGGKTLSEWLAAPTTSELLSNVGPFANTTGWTAVNSTLAATSGELQITADGAGQARASQSITTVVGRVYVVNATVRQGTTTVSVDVLITGITSSSAATTTTPTQVNAVFQATSTTTTIRVGTGGATPAGQTAFVSSISVRELPGNHLRAGTWASPSDAARASYVIQTDPALYNVSGQPELVTNGDFSSGTTGWSISSATLTESGGVLEISAQSTSPVNASQSIMTFVAGRAYMVTGTYWQTGSGGTAARISLFGNTTPNNVTSTPLTASMVVVATGTSATLSLASFGNASTISHFDNISVKEIPVSQYKYALSFGGVDDYYSLLNAISITTDMTVVRAFERASASGNRIGLGNSAAFIYPDVWDSGNTLYARLPSGPNQAGQTATGKMVHTTRRNATTVTIRRNGTEVLTGSPTAPSSTLDVLGRANTSYNSGEISFLAVFPTELTGANLALVEQIAAATNGATLA